MAASAADKLAPVTSVKERPDVNYTFEDVTLVDEEDKQLNWDLTDSLTSATVELATNQASTVKLQFEDEDYAFLEDPALAKWAFGIQDVSVSSARNYSTHKITAATNNINAGMASDMEWVLGQRPIDLYLDKIVFRLCGIETQRTVLTLTFEDRVASYLRHRKGFKTAQRGKVTRAQFVAMLCKEAGVDYFIPELDVKQPIAKDTQASSSRSVGSTNAIGLTTFEGITVKGVKATQSQIDILNTALQVASSLKAPYNACVALVEALITENDVSNPGDGNPADEGVLSITASTAAGLGFDPKDVAASCNAFLTRGYTGQGGAISIANGNPSAPPYTIAQAVQGSGAGSASNGAANYGQWEAEAKTIVNTYQGKATIFGTATVPGTYSFTRGPNEDSWDCIQRLAAEVGWYAFVRENRLWYVSGNYMFSQQAQMDVTRGQSGIDYVDVDLDMGARDQIAEVTVSGRAHLWTALPGQTVQVNRRGPANGKWITTDVNLDLLDESNGCTITLQKPLPARPEPAAPSTTTTNAGSLVGGAPGTVKAAMAAAQQLSDTGIPYSIAHRTLTQTPQAGGYDCSASVSWVLLAGGFKLPGGKSWGDWAPVSGDFTSWGDPGPGKQMTVWCNGGHIFIEFNVPGVGHMQLNTSVPGHDGPDFAPWGPNGSTDAASGQFIARHWPGT